MDPLSIAASSIAFIGACRKLVAGFKFLRSLLRAPEEILALTDELNDLQNTLTAVYLVTRKRHDKVFEELLAPLFSRIDRIIHEICDTCGVCPHKLKEDDEQAEQLKGQLLARFKWTRAKSRVGELREQLKVIRLDFANSLAAISL